MKRFHFPLESVLRVKERREQLAEMRQQQARARLEQEQAECERIEEEVARTAADAEARLREAAALGIWQAVYERTAMLGEQLRAAQRLTDEAEAQLQEADRLRIQASQEAEALRALRARDWEDYRKEAARRRQDNLDEVSLQRWLAARDAGPFGSRDKAEGEGS
jgi:flagellar FliJ protein